MTVFHNWQDLPPDYLSLVFEATNLVEPHEDCLRDNGRKGVLDFFCGIYVAGIAATGPFKKESEYSFSRKWKYEFMIGTDMVPLYVGMTTRPFSERFKNHHALGDLFAADCLSCRFWLFPLGTPSDVLLPIEAALINMLNPPLNRTAPRPPLALLEPSLHS